MRISKLKQRHNILYRNAYLSLGDEVGRLLKKPEKILKIENVDTRRAMCELYLTREVIRENGEGMIVRENGVELYRERGLKQ